MTEIQFRAEDWFDYYPCYLNDRPLIRSLSALDGVEVYDVSIRDGLIRAFLEMEIDVGNWNMFVKEHDSCFEASIKGSYHIDYEIEKNLSSEDIAIAERNLKSAIKSRRTVFKVQTFARAEKNPTTYIDRSRIRMYRGLESVDSEKANELLLAAMEGETTDLGEYSFIKDIVPTPKDERIEFICSVPEELLLKSESSSEQSDYVEKFHLEDWMDYYDAELDKDDLKYLIGEEDCSKVTSIQFDGSLIATNLESSVSEIISVESTDDETGEETEYDVEIGAEFSYSVEYNLNTQDLEHYIKEFDESLNEALNLEESTFEIRVPFSASEAYDLNVYGVEIYEDEADEDDVYAEVVRYLEQSLKSPTDARHNGDFVQPPSNKMVRFICKIPTE